MARYKTVLLVDDNDADNLIHREVLEEEEFAERIEVAWNGREALEYLQSQDPDPEGYFPPDIIFLDINMPIMNGFEFLEEYAKLPEAIRKAVVVVMLTSSVNPLDKENAADLVAGYMTKPLQPENLDKL